MRAIGVSGVSLTFIVLTKTIETFFRMSLCSTEECKSNLEQHGGE